MDWEWGYFFIGFIVFPFLRLLILSINRAVIERRQRRFLKLVNVAFPDKEKITFIALDTSDKRSMIKLERQLREQFDLPPRQTHIRRRQRSAKQR